MQSELWSGLDGKIYATKHYTPYIIEVSPSVTTRKPLHSLRLQTASVLLEKSGIEMAFNGTFRQPCIIVGPLELECQLEEEFRSVGVLSLSLRFWPGGTFTKL
jgi:hypothetical protein